MDERGVRRPAEVRREDDVRQPGPGGDRSNAADVAREHVHRRAREDVAGEDHDVVRGDGAEGLRHQVRRVVRDQPLDVEPAVLLPAERRPGERVIVRRRGDTRPRAAATRPARNGDRTRADDCGVEGKGDGQKRRQTKTCAATTKKPSRRRPEHPGERPERVAGEGQPRPERRRVDEEFVRREQGHADDEIRPEDPRDARRHGCEHRHLNGTAGDDPRVPGLSA